MIKNYILLIIVIMTVAGCANEDHKVPDMKESTYEQISKAMSKFDIVQDIQMNHLLINETNVEVTKNTNLLNAENEKIEFREIQVGDIVFWVGEKTGEDVFPGNGVATKIIVQQDEESKQFAELIRQFISAYGKKVLSTKIDSITEDWVKLSFRDFEVYGKERTVSINKGDFTYIEISETAMEGYVDIEEVRDNELIVNHNIVKITDRTELIDLNQKPITIQELNPGDAIQLRTDGLINDTKPLSYTAKKIILQRHTGE